MSVHVQYKCDFSKYFFDSYSLEFEDAQPTDTGPHRHGTPQTWVPTDMGFNQRKQPHRHRRTHRQMTQQTQGPTDTKEPTDRIGVINTESHRDADGGCCRHTAAHRRRIPPTVFPERCAFQSGCLRHFSVHTK